MKLNEAIEALADVTLGEPITTHEDVRCVLIDLENARRDFTEEEYPEALHLERLAALAIIGKEIA
jgi:hypothetical protein